MGLAWRGNLFLGTKSGAGIKYALESSQNKQFNKIPVKTPFVLGAIIDLGNCLNLLETGSLQILREVYADVSNIAKGYGRELPVNKGNNRALDCSVIQYIHISNFQNNKPPYDTVRCAFPEGTEAYPGAAITYACIYRFVY
jgi:hypothetical protein